MLCLAFTAGRLHIVTVTNLGMIKGNVLTAYLVSRINYPPSIHRTTYIGVLYEGQRSLLKVCILLYLDPSKPLDLP